MSAAELEAPVSSRRELMRHRDLGLSFSDEPYLSLGIAQDPEVMGAPPHDYGPVPDYLVQLYMAQPEEVFDRIPEPVQLAWVRYVHGARTGATTEGQLYRVAQVAHDLALGGFTGADFEVGCALWSLKAYGHARVHFLAAVRQGHPLASGHLDMTGEQIWQHQITCPTARWAR